MFERGPSIVKDRSEWSVLIGWFQRRIPGGECLILSAGEELERSSFWARQRLLVFAQDVRCPLGCMIPKQCQSKPESGGGGGGWGGGLGEE
ncbi:hypothetical protein chiPu_0015845 [Chiloscyllium punctatum]|uniref:Uncharacterized protein n=1 Tax=Chiloscyllium punctatum TaxID=137246 RepID=A0A401T3W1_CHIPU|nr:hypothetical protein [Chiloscyllium punctatum]